MSPGNTKPLEHQLREPMMEQRIVLKLPLVSSSHWRVDHFCPRWLEENFLGRQMLTRLLDPLGGAVLDGGAHVLGRRG